MHVLIVEDDPPSRFLLKTTLAKMGHVVTETENGEEAWEVLLHCEVHLVISDWLMLGTDGLQLCRRIRTELGTKYTYFILLTVLDGKDSYMKGMEAGADDFITKPFDPDRLSARLRVADRILGLQAEVKRLEGLLPICSYCRRIRGREETWLSLEKYIATCTEASFTHTICPTCYETNVRPQLEELEKACHETKPDATQ